MPRPLPSRNSTTSCARPAAARYAHSLHDDGRLRRRREIGQRQVRCDRPVLPVPLRVLATLHRLPLLHVCCAVRLLSTLHTHLPPAATAASRGPPTKQRSRQGAGSSQRKG